MTSTTSSIVQSVVDDASSSVVESKTADYETADDKEWLDTDTWVDAEDW